MFYIHNVPGRLRIRSEARKKNRTAADSVRVALSLIPGIGIVGINLITGSILINYNKLVVNYEDIVCLLDRRGYFDRGKALTNDACIENETIGIRTTIFKTMAGALIGKALADTPLSILGYLL